MFCGGMKMNKDMCVAWDEGILNIRVGAIIMKDGKVLMVGNERANYLYSVGGRIKFGETAEEAVVREVFEETGAKLEVNRLGFVHENYFYGDGPANHGKLIYEVSFYFYMKVPNDFAPVSESFAEDNSREYLKWVSLEEDIKIYPEFFREELKNPTDTVKHFITDER
jgi:ADP-ribose pyrophosphatase YjhB (NUDIX family)